MLKSYNICYQEAAHDEAANEMHSLNIPQKRRRRRKTTTNNAQGICPLNGQDCAEHCWCRALIVPETVTDTAFRPNLCLPYSLEFLLLDKEVVTQGTISVPNM